MALGGGTGLPAVLRALRLLQRFDTTLASITAVVAVTDDGGSSGELRAAYGVLPPGDVRKCVAALAGEDSPVASLLQHRFGEGSSLEGHPIGNVVLAELTRQHGGDFGAAVATLSALAGIDAQVLPATADHVSLRAEHAGGDVTAGETAIASRGLPIRRLFLDGPARPHAGVLEALRTADIVIVGPGSLYTSILPVLLVEEVAATIRALRATRIYVGNLITQPGETDHMSLEQHLDVIHEHTARPLFDYVLVKSRPVAPGALREYAVGSCQPVRRSRTGRFYDGVRVVARDLAWEFAGGKLRHSPVQLAAAISQIVDTTCRMPAARDT